VNQSRALDLALARLADLEAENALLWQALTEPPEGWAGTFRLPRKTYLVVAAIARAAPRAASKDRLIALWDGEACDNPAGSIETMVSKARPLLRAHGVEIRTERGVGYWMTKESAERFKALLRGAAKGSLREAQREDAPE